MTDFEQIKFHTGREIWKKRGKLTPSGEMTWQQWFEVKFGENYAGYVQRMRREKEGKE